MSFEVDVSRWVEKVRGNIDKALRQTVVLAAQGIVMRSPVDTGRFRGNWNFSIGAADTGTSTRVDPAGAATIAKIQAGVARAKAGGIVYLANGLPYGYRLEFEGWSKQAPNGMVRVTLAGLPVAVADYVSRLR